LAGRSSLRVEAYTLILAGRLSEADAVFKSATKKSAEFAALGQGERIF
jgi:hypothetical protein